MPNIEIKAAYPDHDRAKKILMSLNAKHVGTDHQIDTYFFSPQGRLKLRESSLSGAQLIPYMRPDQQGPKKSDYLVIPIVDPEACKRLFTQILGQDVVVDKIRDIYLIDNVRVHLDQVKGLGLFFEFEAVYQNAHDEPTEYHKVRELIAIFGIREQNLINGSYRELVKGNKS
ncbi:MAG: adenylate cyclase [uncultured bacterium]|nr:MAG: adenylate cyclase [uncultured bacterium]